MLGAGKRQNQPVTLLLSVRIATGSFISMPKTPSCLQSTVWKIL